MRTSNFRVHRFRVLNFLQILQKTLTLKFCFKEQFRFSGFASSSSTESFELADLLKGFESGGPPVCNAWIILFFEKWANLGLFFVYFRFFHMTQLKMYERLDGMLGTQTLAGRMEGVDESTVHPTLIILFPVLKRRFPE